MTKKKWEVNAFQVPNVLVDDYISDLSSHSFKLLVFIIRKTKGWGKRRDSISATQLAEVLGHKKTRHVYPYIRELEDLNIIKVYKKQGRINQYALHIPVTKKGSTKKDTSDQKGQYLVTKKGSGTSDQKGHSTIETNKETVEKEKSIGKSQTEIIDSFVPNETCIKVVRKKYPTINVNAEVLEDLTETFKDAMRVRVSPWKDIESCFRNYVKGEYIEITKPILIVDEKPKVSYSDHVRYIETQVASQVIEGEAI